MLGIHEETYERLVRRKLCGSESFDSVINRIINNEKVHPK